MLDRNQDTDSGACKLTHGGKKVFDCFVSFSFWAQEWTLEFRVSLIINSAKTSIKSDFYQPLSSMAVLNMRQDRWHLAGELMSVATLTHTHTHRESRLFVLSLVIALLACHKSNKALSLGKYDWPISAKEHCKYRPIINNPAGWRLTCTCFLLCHHKTKLWQLIAAG